MDVSANPVLVLAPHSERFLLDTDSDFGHLSGESSGFNIHHAPGNGASAVAPLHSLRSRRNSSPAALVGTHTFALFALPNTITSLCVQDRPSANSAPMAHSMHVRHSSQRVPAPILHPRNVLNPNANVHLGDPPASTGPHAVASGLAAAGLHVTTGLHTITNTPAIHQCQELTEKFRSSFVSASPDVLILL